MKEEFSRLYDDILFDPRIMSALSRSRPSHFEGQLDYLWGVADSDIFFFACMLNSPDVDVAQALVFVDYLSYVPYGEKGYEEMDRIVKTMGFDGVADWRYARFIKSLGEKADTLSPELSETIKSFLDGYLKEEIDPKDIYDVTRAVCRVRHAYEACKLSEQWSSEQISDGEDALLEVLQEGKKFLMSEFLAKCPKIEVLGEKELEFLKETAAK